MLARHRIRASPCPWLHCLTTLPAAFAEQACGRGVLRGDGQHRWRVGSLREKLADSTCSAITFACLAARRGPSP
ncbi:MAG: hypothetical protein JWQ26_1086 [Modestobacter sp.]|nr:hypothetical protein [Modestobacter sp.]